LKGKRTEFGGKAMTTIQLKATVPESRQVTLTLPPDVPVGEAELEITVRRPGEEVPVFEVVLPPDDCPHVFPSRPTHPKLAAEHDAFERMLPELMKTLAGKYVAVHDGAVVAVGDDRIEALTRAHAAHPGVLVLARKVTDQPEPIPRISSPRVVRRG
jgi:hypothetical protein